MKKKAPETVLRPIGAAVVKIPGKGRGIIATRSFKKGDIVEVAPMIYIPPNDADVISMTALGDYLFSAANGGSAIALGFTSLYNHSRRSNCDYSTGEQVIMVYARKPIKKGDELTINYGWSKSHLQASGINPRS